MSRPMFIPLRRTSAAMNLNLNARTFRRQLWVGLALAVIVAGALYNLARSQGGSLKKDSARLIIKSFCRGCRSTQPR
jgi:hypothetical protein